jgi:hypothetical protein
MLGRAIVHVLSGRLLTAAARVRSQIRSCVIYGGHSGTGEGFLRVLRFPLSIIISQAAPYSLKSSCRPKLYRLNTILTSAIK